MPNARTHYSDGKPRKTSVHLTRDVSEAVLRVQARFGPKWSKSAAIAEALLEACQRAESETGLLPDEQALADAWDDFVLVRGSDEIAAAVSAIVNRARTRYRPSYD